MPRFSKGTTDHDDDGRMGGSMKGDLTMAKKPKVPKVEPAPAPKPTKKAALEQQFAEAAAKADPAEVNVAEIQAGLAVRGY